MKCKSVVGFAAVVWLWAVAGIGWAQSGLSTAFTYQGRLLDQGDAATGAYDLEFTLYDAETSGTVVAGPVTLSGVNLVDGLFMVSLDFGDVWDGSQYWLEIAVRAAGSSAFETLTPRQALFITPQAGFALHAPWSGLEGVPAGFADGSDDDTTYSAGSGLTLSGTTFSADMSVVQARVTGTCPAGQAIRSILADGTVTCEADDDTTYAAGTGLTLSGTTFSVDTSAVQARVTGSCPAGQAIRSILADGTVTCEADDNTTYSAGPGLTLTGTTFAADLAGSGAATTVSRSDHDHVGQTWTGSSSNQTPMLTLDGGSSGIRTQTSTSGLDATVTDGQGWAVTARNSDATTYGATGGAIYAISDFVNRWAIRAHNTDTTNATSGSPGGAIYAIADHGNAWAIEAHNTTSSFSGSSGGVIQAIAEGGNNHVIEAINTDTRSGSLANAVRGITSALNSTAIYGASAGIPTGSEDATQSVGVYGTTGHGMGVGVAGVMSNPSNPPAAQQSIGVLGRNDYNNGTGVFGFNTAPDGVNYAVRGYAASPTGYAGYFEGNVHVTGTLSKTAGAFVIDHPLDPENKLLYHSFVESPDMKNIYDGTVVLDDKGEARVELPDWFEALNRDFRYQLTCVGGYAPVYVKREIAKNSFVIGGGTPGLEVSWQVTGIRRDKAAEYYRIPVEVDKRPEERGKYLNPEAFGLDRSKGIAPVPTESLTTLGSRDQAPAEHPDHSLAARR